LGRYVKVGNVAAAWASFQNETGAQKNGAEPLRFGAA
jgi:hypothetical protein